MKGTGGDQRQQFPVWGRMSFVLALGAGDEDLRKSGILVQLLAMKYIRILDSK
jgi:hypothetical protein